MAIKYTERAIVRVPSKKPMATKNRTDEEVAADRWLLAVTAVMLVGASVGDAIVQFVQALIH